MYNSYIVYIRYLFTTILLYMIYMYMYNIYLLLRLIRFPHVQAYQVLVLYFLVPIFKVDGTYKNNFNLIK